MNKPRKSLNDALATEFVYGEADNPVTENKPTPYNEKPQERKPSIMEKLLPVESKEATKRFTVDLPESMHRKLSILSAKTGRSKADIVRTLLEDVLQNLNE